jgi:D-3-phosphoglycerate dehydrogenase / 2-oxoglutarate reductase
VANFRDRFARTVTSADSAMTFRLLVTDEIDPEGIELLRAVPEFQIDVVPTLPVPELLARIGEYDAIVGRSATKISEQVLRAGTRLRVVGRAGVGIDNIAMDVATELGIAVINAPGGNTIAVAELFFGAVIGLLRHIPAADQSMHVGRWDRSALMGSELRGRTLGIIGLGRIGTAVAVRARAFGMTLMAYDPYIADERFTAVGVAQAPSLEALLAASDIITVHTPLNDETRGLIDAAALAKLRQGAIVCNLARGGIVDDAALRAACESGQLGGAVLDVYTSEPLTGEHPYCPRSEMLLMPHLGASTVEAQRDVAIDVCAAVRDALLEGELSRSVNIAAGPEDWRAVRPALDLARNAAAVARARLRDAGHRAIEGVTVKVGPDLTPAAGLILAAAAAGALEGVVAGDRLNFINVRNVAAARGVELAITQGGDAPHPRAVEVRLRAGGTELRVGGVAAADAPARLTRIGAFHVDVAPRGTLIVIGNADVPGVVGRVGTLLGDAGVNIAEYHQARLAAGGEALAVISVDGMPDPDVRVRLLAIPEVQWATIVHLQG